MSNTVISKGTKIEGNISSKEDLIVFGDINGIIEVSETVSLESGCNVVGKIFAQSLIVKGLFTGDADCTKISVNEGGKFIGNLESEILVIDTKGAFEGTSKIKKSTLEKNEKKKKVYKELDTENILL